MKNLKLTATCAGGLEQLVENEIYDCGGSNVVVSTGVVSWRGDMEAAYRLCLWSRYASRVFIQISDFLIENEQTLYEGALDVRWSDHLDVNTSFAINCTISGKCPVSHNRYAALKLKDALVDYFRNRSGERPSVQGERPDLQIHLHLNGKQALLFIDLSGESLHRRGYRASGTLAPLKETLGAAIVALGGWKEYDGPLIDPMCGSGTLLIEAALMFGDSAPGLSRKYFGFFGWSQHNELLWQKLVEEAVKREELMINRKWPLLLGYDADPVAVSAARKNVVKAGLEDKIQIKQAELATLLPPSKTGMILSNLPYGERLSEKKIVTYLYRAFGRIVKKKFVGWRLGVFISNPDLTDSFNLVWEKKDKLFNGAIPCRLLSGEIPRWSDSEFVWKIPEKQSKDSTNEFGNRLRKNLKRLMKWAGKEKVACFRVYDRDLPEYNLSIDLYSKWIHVQEYAPPKLIDSDVAALRMREALENIRKIFGVRSNRIFVKRRERQKGRKQYEKKSSKHKMYEIREGECFFLVNFTDYLDTGLFLDHRPVRQRIFLESKNKRFLNLYGYTSAASVHAAMGGAAGTTTVDLSANYLDWAKMNFAVNGLAEGRNRFVKADCLQWLREEKGLYDLIFIDPPTFSNTKKQKRVFDIQRDHSLLLHLAMKRLASGGIIIFSTNYKRFKLDENLLDQYEIFDITAKTIPFDFTRNQRIHSCWEIHHQCSK